MSSETNGPVSPLGNLGRCAYCGLTGRGELFEPFNAAGNLACRDNAACLSRQAAQELPRQLGYARQARCQGGRREGPGAGLAARLGAGRAGEHHRSPAVADGH